MSLAKLAAAQLGARIPDPSCSGWKGKAGTCAWAVDQRQSWLRGGAWERGVVEGRGFGLVEGRTLRLGRSKSSSGPRSGLSRVSSSSHFASRPRWLQSWVSGQLAPGERAKLWGVEFRGPRLAESPKLGPGKWRSSGATKGECTSFLRLQLLASGLVLKVPDADGRSRGDPFPAIPALTHRQLDLVRKGGGGAPVPIRERGPASFLGNLHGKTWSLAWASTASP